IDGVPHRRGQVRNPRADIDDSGLKFGRQKFTLEIIVVEKVVGIAGIINGRISRVSYCSGHGRLRCLQIGVSKRNVLNPDPVKIPKALNTLVIPASEINYPRHISSMAKRVTVFAPPTDTFRTCLLGLGIISDRKSTRLNSSHSSIS